MSTTTVETLTLDVRMDTGENDMVGIFTSLTFDSDGDNELNVVSFSEVGWANPNGKRTMNPFKPGISSSQESTTGSGGELVTLESTAGNLGAKNINWTFATIVFETNPSNVTTDGDDVESEFIPGRDGASTTAR